MTRAIKAKLVQEKKEWKLRDELNELLAMPMSEWSFDILDRVEELAGLLGFAENDCYWRL